MPDQPLTIIPADPDSIRIVQITDMHVLPAAERPFQGVDTAHTLERVIAAINADATPPDLILATGDLAHDPVPEAYTRLRAILERAAAPVVCLPGNHDLPGLMQNLLNGGRISTAKHIRCGGWELVLLDTVVAGREHGNLSESELAFFEQRLQGITGQYVVIALHHHPVDIGSPWMDAMKLANNEAFLDIINKCPQVRCVLWGHIHQDFNSRLGQIQLIGSPSTCLQFKPNTLQFEKDTLPPAYRKLELGRDGRVTTTLCWLDAALAHDSVSWD